MFFNVIVFMIARSYTANVVTWDTFTWSAVPTHTVPTMDDWVKFRTDVVRRVGVEKAVVVKPFPTTLHK